MEAATTETNGAMCHVPTLAERFWRWAGFRYHLGDEPPEADKMLGWMVTESGFKFGFADRLRLLLTGRLHLRIVQHTDAQIDSALNRVDWQILSPIDTI